jgi:hypothetical protein
MKFWPKITNGTHQKGMNGHFFHVAYSPGCMNVESRMSFDQFFELCSWFSVLFQVLTPPKKNRLVGLSDMALDTIVQCYVRKACLTGFSNMGLDNSV